MIPVPIEKKNLFADCCYSMPQQFFLPGPSKLVSRGMKCTGADWNMEFATIAANKEMGLL